MKINPENISSEMINELKELINENKGETELKFLFLIQMIRSLFRCFQEHSG